MTASRVINAGHTRAVNLARLMVGFIWLAGGAFNLLVTLRMSRPYEWLEESPVPVYRWFFRDVAGSHPVFWTILLVIGEVTLGILTLSRGHRARIGLALGAVFSAMIFSFASVYTLMMGPYAVLLAWLCRQEYSGGPLEQIRSILRDHEERAGRDANR